MGQYARILESRYRILVLDGRVLISMSSIHNPEPRSPFFKALQAGRTGFYDQNPRFQPPWIYFLRLWSILYHARLFKNNEGLDPLLRRIGFCGSEWVRSRSTRDLFGRSRYKMLKDTLHIGGCPDSYPNALSDSLPLSI